MRTPGLDTHHEGRWTEKHKLGLVGLVLQHSELCRYLLLECKFKSWLLVSTQQRVGRQGRTESLRFATHVGDSDEAPGSSVVQPWLFIWEKSAVARTVSPCPAFTEIFLKRLYHTSHGKREDSSLGLGTVCNGGASWVLAGGGRWHLYQAGRVGRTRSH